MIDETLRQLIEFVKEVSPIVWESMLQQVRVEAYSFLVWAAFALFITIALLWLGNFSMKQYREDRDSDWNVLFWMFRVLALFASGFVIDLVLQAVRYFANPTYYAIQLLLNFIP